MISTSSPPAAANTSGPSIGADGGLITRMQAGERRAIAEAASACERGGAALGALMPAMEPHLGQARLVGITGPPGAGKSTLVNALIRHVRGLGHRVGVIAVDPSSPISGGAILGDRVRMTAALDDDGVFVRSVASRGALGGLSPAAVRMVDALDAAGFAVILIETVGTGQSEIDIAEVADVRVVVNAPGLGDDIQAMKAGLLEIADVMVVNKGDRPDADATLAQLKAALSIRAGGDRVPAVKVTATTGAGVAALWEAIAPIGERAASAGGAARRLRRVRYLMARAAAELVATRIRTNAGGATDALAADVLAGRLTLEEAARRLVGG